jgi:hypothetical protein
LYSPQWRHIQHGSGAAQELIQMDDPHVEAFRDWLVREYRADGSYDGISTASGADAGGADVAVRLQCGPRSYYEARVHSGERELQVGFSTEGRTVNEEIEEMILDNGGDLDDLLADELCDLGEEPLHMEHFFERPAFRYIVRLPLENPAGLEDAGLRKRVTTVLQACRILFQDRVDGS